MGFKVKLAPRDIIGPYGRKLASAMLDSAVGTVQEKSVLKYKKLLWKPSALFSRT